MFLLMLVLPLFNFYPSLRTRALLSYFNGIELNSKDVRNDGIHQLLANCPKTAKIAADLPWNFDLMFNEKVKWLPRHTYHVSHDVNDNYVFDLNSLASSVDIIIIQDKNNNSILDVDKLAEFKRVPNIQEFIWINKSYNECLKGSLSQQAEFSK